MFYYNFVLCAHKKFRFLIFFVAILYIFCIGDDTEGCYFSYNICLKEAKTSILMCSFTDFKTCILRCFYLFLHLLFK